MKNKWSKDELEPLLWAAMLIAEQRMSYYRASHALSAVLPARSYEAVRTKLKQAVGKIRTGMALINDAPLYRPHVYVGHGFLTEKPEHVVRNMIPPAALSLSRSKNFLVQSESAARNAMLAANGWTRDVDGFLESALLCEHANECPHVCPCPSDCHCRAPGNTCGKRLTPEERAARRS